MEKPAEIKLEIVRTIEVSTLIAAQTQQNMSKSKNEPVLAQKKVQLVELTPSSLYLSYNKLRSLKGFYGIVNAVFPAIQNLRWLDLAHNQLVVLDYVQCSLTIGLQGAPHAQDIVPALQLSQGFR